MNFLKGIVDGILADDIDRAQGQGTLQRSFVGDSRTDNDDTSLQQDNLSRKLDDVYREERRNCITSLIIRYGEGCVQQLNELLKTNDDTVKTLAKRLDDAYRSLGDFNTELETLTQENVQLRKTNAELTNQIELLRSENVSLKTVIAQAELETKSQEARISDLSELLKDNAATFSKMQSRCDGIAESAAEIETLKMELATAQTHIEALIRERDALVDAASNADNRIKEAMRRQDRAIAIAKLMAQETTFLVAQNAANQQHSSANNDHQKIAKMSQKVSKFKAQVDHLQEENAHLKEVNDKLHNMFADLSNNTKQLKETYLLESIETLGKRHLKQLKPIQLIFIQPTRVLDLDLDLKLISAEMSDVMQRMQQKEQPKQQPVTKQEPIKPVQPTLETHLTEQTTIPTKNTTPIPQEFKQPKDSSVTAPSDTKKKEAWGSDWDVYDEILQEETPVETGAINTPGHFTPATLGVKPAVKSDLSESKSVWDDDLDELLKEQ